ncbi:MAG: hypothetical protein QNJ14_10465 [Woeseiaceae bacterium]|nr:hypothetical protein [Woeseiaceae bacterium]
MTEKQAFWIAALIALAFLPLFFLVGMLLEGAQVEAFYFSGLVLVFCCSGFLTVLLPFALILRKKGFLQLWSMALAGFVSGPLWAILAQLVYRLFDDSWTVDIEFVFWAAGPSLLIAIIFAVSYWLLNLYVDDPDATIPEESD